MSLQGVFTSAPPPAVEVLPLARRRTRARAAARFGVEYDLDRDVYVVSLGRLSEEACDVAATREWLTRFELPARSLLPEVHRLLRRHRREGEAVLRFLRKAAQ